MNLLCITGDLHGHHHGPYWSSPWSPVSRELVVRAVGSSVWLETRRGAANTTGCVDQPCSRAARASSSIPVAALVHTGRSGPSPRVSAKGVLALGRGAGGGGGRAGKRSQPCSALSPSGWRMLWWQRGCRGRGSGSAPGVWAVPGRNRGAHGPPQLCSAQSHRGRSRRSRSRATSERVSKPGWQDRLP